MALSTLPLSCKFLVNLCLPLSLGSSNILGSKPTSFKKPFAAPIFTACPKLDLPLPLPTLVSFFRMGIQEVVGFFCTVGVGGRRCFFFVDTVPKLVGVTSIAFHFGVAPLLIFLNMFSNWSLAILSPVRRVLDQLQRRSHSDEYVWSIWLVVWPTVWPSWRLWHRKS